MPKKPVVKPKTTFRPLRKQSIPASNLVKRGLAQFDVNRKLILSLKGEKLLLAKWKEKLEKGGYLIFETYNRSFIENRHLFAAGFRKVLIPLKKKDGTYFLVAVKK